VAKAPGQSINARNQGRESGQGVRAGSQGRESGQGVRAGSQGSASGEDKDTRVENQVTTSRQGHQDINVKASGHDISGYHQGVERHHQKIRAAAKPDFANRA
jgi:hypothetical protein